MKKKAIVALCLAAAPRGSADAAMQLARQIGPGAHPEPGERTLNREWIKNGYDCIKQKENI